MTRDETIDVIIAGELVTGKVKRGDALRIRRTELETFASNQDLEDILHDLQEEEEHENNPRT